jgi:hypothetical protein
MLPLVELIPHVLMPSMPLMLLVKLPVQNVQLMERLDVLL